MVRRGISRRSGIRGCVGRGPAACGLILALAACGDNPIEPPPSSRPEIDVTVSVTLVDGPHIEQGDGGRIIRCDVHLKAEATGDGQATWQEAVFRWYAGVDRTTPLDTEVVTAAEIRESWQGGTIAAGGVRAVIWRIGAPIPFALAVTFTYERVGGTGRKTADVAFTCGPPIPPGTRPPAVTDLTVQGPGGVVEPGDTVVVEFTATSTVGLWQTAAVLTGPCTVGVVFDERLEHSVRRTARLPLPPECALGVPIAVGAFALDAAVQEGMAETDPGFVLTDVTPPTVSVTVPMDPLYFVGDSMPVWVSATDNVAVRWLHWELRPAGIRDSVHAVGQLWESYFALTIPATWAGEASALAFWAEDGNGLASDTAWPAAPVIRVLSTVSRPTVTTTVSGMPRATLVDEARGRVYLLQTEPEGIAFLETASLALVSTLPLPVQGIDFDLTPGGDSLLISLAGRPELGVVDLRGATPQLTFLALPGADTSRYFPWFIRTVGNGRAFLHLEGRNGVPPALLEIGLGAGGTQRIRADAGADGDVGAGYLEVSRDRTRLVVNGGADRFQRYDASADAFGPLRTSIGWGPPGVDAAGAHVLVGLTLYDADLAFLRSIETDPPDQVNRPTALAPAADYVYQYGDVNAVWRARVGDGKLLDRTRVPFLPEHLHVSPSGATLVVTAPVIGYNQTRVAVVDLR